MGVDEYERLHDAIAKLTANYFESKEILLQLASKLDGLVKEDAAIRREIDHLKVTVAGLQQWAADHKLYHAEIQGGVKAIKVLAGLGILGGGVTVIDLLQKL